MHTTLRFLLFLLVGGMLAACSSKKDNGLDAQLAAVGADDVQFIAAGNIEKLFDQLDVKVEEGKMELPSYMSTALALVDRQHRDLIVELADNVEGIAFDSAVLAVTCDENECSGILVFGVDDFGKFASSVKKLDKNAKESSSDGYDCVTFDGHCVAVKDNLGYAVFDCAGSTTCDNATAIISAWTAKAAETPLSDWKNKILHRDNVVNALFDTAAGAVVARCAGQSAQWDVQKAAGAMGDYVGMSLNLDGPVMKLASEALDKTGKVVKSNLGGNFNTTLMQYALPSDIIALSVCFNQKGYEAMGEAFRTAFHQYVVPEMDGYFDIRHATQMVDVMSRIPEEYLSDGGIFASAGFAGDLTMANFDPMSPDTYHFALAAEIKSDKASQAYAEVCREIAGVTGTDGRTTDSGTTRSKTYTVKVADKYDYRTGDWKTKTVDISVALDGNVLVVTNGQPVKNEKTPFDSEIFAGSLVGLQIAVNDKTPILSDFGLKDSLTLSAYAKPEISQLEIKIGGADRKIIPALVGILQGQF